MPLSNGRAVHPMLEKEALAMRRPTTSFTRMFARGVLTLTSALLCGEVLASEKKCFDRLYACYNRCHAAATTKYGTDSKAGPGPANDAAAACSRRTCDNQLKVCVAAEKGKQAPLTQQQPTRPPTTAPVQPLTPQRTTSSPASAPTIPLISQNATRSPVTSPRRPLTSTPSFRRSGR
jgi:hypothetical protein